MKEIVSVLEAGRGGKGVFPKRAFQYKHIRPGESRKTMDLMNITNVLQRPVSGKVRVEAKRRRLSNKWVMMKWENLVVKSR